MSQHFWMTTGATIVVAGVLGLGLGSFATTTQHAPMENEIAEQASYDDSYAASTATAEGQTGPAVVRCTGCGPTLADRQWHADVANLYPDTPDMDAIADPVASKDMIYDEPDFAPAHRVQPLPALDYAQPVMVRPTMGNEAGAPLLTPDMAQDSGDRPRS